MDSTTLDNFQALTSKRTGSYGSYILNTGAKVQQWELLFGRYLYRTRFRDLAPVLDIAPGRCWFTKQNPAQIIGLDIEPALVEHYSSQGLDVRQGDVKQIPFPDGAFQGVFCCWLFEHLPDPESALSDVRRVLQPGGYACIIVPTPKTLLRGFYDDYTHIRPFTKTSLTQLAKAVGFSKIVVDYLFYTRGSRHVLRLFGPDLTFRWLRLGDTLGRKLGVVNRWNFVLEAWK